MTDGELQKQAQAVSTGLSGLMRRISALDEDSAAELPVAQVRVCALLRDGPSSMTALSKELGISLSAVTQVADRLERGGLVERVIEEEDRRVKLLQLTPRALELLRRRRETRLQRITALLEKLSPQTRADVLRAFEALLEAGET